MKHSDKLYSILAVAAVVVLTALTSVAGSRKSSDPDFDARKADFYYLEAVNRKLKGDLAAYYELLTRAYELNPTDSALMFEYGFYNRYLKAPASDSDDPYLAIMRAGIDADPSDPVFSYAYISLIKDDDPAEALRVSRRLHYLNPTRPEMAYRYANILNSTRDSADTRRAIAVLDTLEITQGRSAGLTSNKLQMLFQLNDTTAMEAEIDSLLKSAPSSVDANILAGHLYTALERPSMAISYYDRACELDSTNGEAFYNRAEYYRNAGDSVAYDREVFNALGKTSLDVEVKLVLMRDYVKNLYGDSLQQPRIINLFDHLVQQHPHEAAIHDLYANYLIMVQDYRGAAEQTGYVLDLAPDNESDWLRLSALYSLLKDNDKALETVNNGLRYFPKSNSLYETGAYALQAMKKYPEAVTMMERAIEVTDSADIESISNSYTGLGGIYQMAENNDSAEVAYRHALEFNPANAGALNNYAYLLAVEGRDLDHALAMIDKALRSDNNNVSWLDTYAWVLFRLKDYKGAREKIDRTIEYSEEMTAEVLEHAGDIYFMNGEPDQALEFWKEALELDPDNEMLKRKVKHKTYFFK